MIKAMSLLPTERPSFRRRSRAFCSATRPYRPSLSTSISKAVGVHFSQVRESFIYCPLENPHAEIRLVSLLPRSHRAKTNGRLLSCSIEHTSLAQKPIYVCLSYAWGDLAQTQSILLNNRTFYITENLAVALEHLESEQTALSIWIDALCINQKDEKEKSVQVEQMGTIFRQAAMVIAWLGPATPESHDAMQKLSNISQVPHEYDTPSAVTSEITKRLQEGLKTRDGLFGLASVLQFLRRPWFQRAWVIQEICLPPEVIFMCGYHDITLLDLSAALYCLTIFAQAYRRSSFMPLEMMAQLILTKMNPVAFTTLHLAEFSKSLSAKDLLLATNRGFSQEDIVQATDPRDRIYALLGLANDTQVLNLRPDYSKPCHLVYTEFTEAILMAGGDLDILSKCQFPRLQTGLPSWVPDWSIAFPFCIAAKSDGFFSASGTSQPSLSIYHDSSGRRVLVLAGTRIDTLHIVIRQFHSYEGEGPSFPHGSAYLREVESLLDQKESIYSSTERENALWRTPIGDCDSTSNSPTNLNYRLVKANELMLNSYRALRDFSEDLEVLESDLARVVQQGVHSMRYLEVLEIKLRRRKMFITSQGYLGLGPQNMQPKDLVCIFLGGHIPFIVRETTMDGHYELIGEAYVYGIMDGEFMAKNPPIERFTLI